MPPGPAPEPSTTRPAYRESGQSLIEIMLAVVIMGTAVVALLGGLGTSILGSAMHRQHSTGETLARTLSEDLKRQTYVTCATTSSYTTTGASLPTGYSASITAVDFWAPPTSTTTAAGGGTSAAPATFVSAGALGTCPASDTGLQRVTLLVQSPDSRVAEHVQVLVRAS